MREIRDRNTDAADRAIPGIEPAEQPERLCRNLRRNIGIFFELALLCHGAKLIVTHRDGQLPALESLFPMDFTALGKQV